MNREIQEKDEKQPGKWKRVGRFCLKYPVSILFALAIAYYAVQVYVFDINPFINRLIVYGLAVLWILWLGGAPHGQVVLAAVVCGRFALWLELVCYPGNQKM